MQNKEKKKFVAYSRAHKIGSNKTRGQSVGILMVSLVLHKVMTKIWLDTGIISFSVGLNILQLQHMDKRLS